MAAFLVPILPLAAAGGLLSPSTSQPLKTAGEVPLSGTSPAS